MHVKTYSVHYVDQIILINRCQQKKQDKLCVCISFFVHHSHAAMSQQLLNNIEHVLTLTDEVVSTDTAYDVMKCLK